MLHPPPQASSKKKLDLLIPVQEMSITATGIEQIPRAI